MGHVPHLLIPGPWSDTHLGLDSEQTNHLVKVLRIRDGVSPVTYTDGAGTSGVGTFDGRRVLRGQERPVARPTNLIVATAPPRSRDRQRFLVEKLSEMGVEGMLWLSTRHGTGAPPPAAKTRAWAQSALEQSGGAWLMTAPSRLVGWDELEAPIVVCAGDGTEEPAGARTVVIGPEGGWAVGEVPPQLPRWNLGPLTLRVETAALVAASRLV